MIRHLRCQSVVPLLMSLLLAMPGGCALVGYVASAVPQTVDAQYKGLKGESVAVMVWADAPIRNDWGSQLQTDTASSIQSKLVQVQQAQKPDQLLETTFPVSALSVAKYQQQYPRIQYLPITEVAPKLGVSRLIYVEVEQFTTRGAAEGLFRGVMSGTVRVIEVKPDRTAHVAYEENNVMAVYPPKSPPEGVMGLDLYKVRTGTVDAFTTEVVNRFIKHEQKP